MSQRIEFNGEGFEKHVCQGSRDGDWLIFVCPECSYRREWNPQTSEMHIIDSGNKNALHSGWFQPVGLQMEKMNPN